MTLAGAPSNGEGNGETGWGFYLDGTLGELDTVGEWFYDEETKLVYLSTPAGVSFDDSLVEGMWEETGVSVSNAVVEGVCFRHFTGTGLEVTRASIIRSSFFMMRAKAS